MGESFCDLVRAYLVEVEHETKEEADRLVEEHKDIVIQGVLNGNIAATAMALQMQDTTNG